MNFIKPISGLSSSLLQGNSSSLIGIYYCSGLDLCSPNFYTLGTTLTVLISTLSAFDKILCVSLLSLR
jgi:hypothetical protein